jgi:predicted dehydrogenase
MTKINVLIVGSGHYSTGTTVLSGKKTTDKDHGVLLPSVLELRSRGMIDHISMVARDGTKLKGLTEKIRNMSDENGWNDEISFYPKCDSIDEEAYIKAIEEMPRPCAVLIAVPDYLHSDIMSCCIKNNVPFMVVKPAVTRLNDLYSLLDKLDASPVLAMVDYHKVYDDANIMLKAEYQGGAYGKIQHFSSLMTQRRDMLEIFGPSFSSEHPPNINHYLGSHYIHMVGYITDAEPIDVRAISQMGVADKMLATDGVADLIETQVRWRDKNADIFTSYHVSGWNDPSESESMTYQEIHMLCENGHVDSDQRYRGLRKVLSGEGYSVPNPYFFNLNRGPGGKSIDTKYGFLSVKTFIESCLDVYSGKVTLVELDDRLPTLRQSESVTAIMEAADLSLANDCCIVKIDRINNKYCCFG